LDFNWEITCGFPIDIWISRGKEFTESVTAKAPILAYTGTGDLRRKSFTIDPALYYGQDIKVWSNKGGCEDYYRAVIYDVSGNEVH